VAYDATTLANMLRYWHPVLRSAALPRNGAAPIRIGGAPIALFRSGGGRVSAIADQCAHRRMTLSRGRVDGERLICPYHGWSYGADGAGHSPGTPRLQACVESYDCEEALGSIWIRGRHSDAALNVPAADNMRFAGAVFSPVAAPLQIVMDNFSEVEHTVSLHPDFGFDREHAGEASVVLDATAESVAVRCDGPAKMPPIDTRIAGGIRRGDRFHADFTFRFDPPRSAVRHFWYASQDERPRRIEYRLVHYFVPADDANTIVVTFAFLDIRRALFSMLAPAVNWRFRRKLQGAVDEDAAVLEHLADQSTTLDGMKLGRFDRTLGLTRERLDRIYYGTTAD